VRTKVIELLPEKEKRKVLAISAKPSATDVNEQRESLQDWLGDLPRRAKPSSSSPAVGHPSISTLQAKKSNHVPVRATVHNHIGVGDNGEAPREVSSSLRGKKEEVYVFRKEKLSTKEYYDRWDKYEATSSDEETEIDCTKKNHFEDPVTEEETAQARGESELLLLQESLDELTLAERKFMSIREREKGNEYFSAGENNAAISCYSKSILFDESNAKSYANRAAAYIRESNFDRTIEDCTKAIEIDPNFVKALARRGMCYHKIERYEDAVDDFEACHEAKSDAGYEMLLQRSKDKIFERSKKLNTMVVVEADGSSDKNSLACDPEQYDYIEEIYTRDALEAEQQERDKKRNISPRLSTHAKANSSRKSDSSDDMKVDSPIQDISGSSTPQTFQAWHKISIIETSDSDEDVAEIGARRVDIVEETDSEGEEIQHNITVPSPAQRADSLKLKEEGNAAMKSKPSRVSDAVKFYSLALDADPNNTAALNNRSIAYIKLKEWEKSIADASSCLEIEPNNTKALYRRGCGKMQSVDTGAHQVKSLSTASQEASSIKEALDDFQLALSFDPPIEQSRLLSKKVDECTKILSMMKVVHELGSKATEKKKKMRSHNSQALAF